MKKPVVIVGILLIAAIAGLTGSRVAAQITPTNNGPCSYPYLFPCPGGYTCTNDPNCFGIATQDQYLACLGTNTFCVSTGPRWVCVGSNSFFQPCPCCAVLACPGSCP